MTKNLYHHIKRSSPLVEAIPYGMACTELSRAIYKPNPFSAINYIQVIDNRSKHYDLDEIVTVCKRVNNAKRDYLFVNPLQGKHIPVSPTRAFTLYEELLEQVVMGSDPGEKIAVVGFAETATAIGQYIARRLPQCVYRLQTTREVIPGQTPCIHFAETHSHAVEQVIYADIDILKTVDRILFVEDEITTGNTILNFIEEIKTIVPNVKFAVASILNWQAVARSEKFKEMDIPTYYVVRSELTDLDAKVDIEQYVAPVACVCKDMESVHHHSLYSPHTNYLADRAGMRNTSKQAPNYKAICKQLLGDSKKVLVLGTEEFMYAGLEFGYYIENSYDTDVIFHATTRSPIAPSGQEDYGVKYGFELTSAYDTERKTFIYNLSGNYDKVIVATDVKPNDQFIASILGALRTVGYSNDLEIVQFTQEEALACN